MSLNFPSNPADQEEYSGYIYDAAKGVWNKKPIDSDSITEGPTNLYFTNQRAIGATSAAYDTLGSAASALSSANNYTDAAISGLVDSAPGALDTLNELAAALGDDSNFASNIVSSINSLEVNSLADVTITTPADGQVLAYNSGTWENQALSAGASSAAGLELITSGSAFVSGGAYYVNNVFSADYDVYRVLLKFPTGEAQGSGIFYFTDSSGNRMYTSARMFSWNFIASPPAFPSSYTSRDSLRVLIDDEAFSEFVITYPFDPSKRTSLNQTLHYTNNPGEGRAFATLAPAQHFGFMYFTSSTNPLEYFVYGYKK